MFDHLGIVVGDLMRSRHFYEASLAPLGFRLLEDNASPVGPHWLVFGSGDADPFFVISESRPSFWDDVHGERSPIHVAFAAPSEAAVEAFHRGGLHAGGRDNGPPGPRRASYRYYAAFLLDPDGNNVEAGFKGP